VSAFVYQSVSFLFVFLFFLLLIFVLSIAQANNMHCHIHENLEVFCCVFVCFFLLSLLRLFHYSSLSFFAKKKTSIKVYKMVTRNDCFLTDWMIQKFAPQLSTKEKYLYNDKKRNKEKGLFRLNILIFYFIKYILRHKKFSNEYLVCIDSSAFTEKIYVNNYDWILRDNRYNKYRK